MHLNFPFEEPLKPALDHPDLFVLERSRWCGGAGGCGSLPRSARACAPAGALTDEAAATIEALLAENTAVIMAGEGSIETPEDAEALMRLAAQRSIPVLADPLSNLRQRIDELLIDHYDNIFGKPGLADFDLVVRFGRYPVSKRAAQYVQRHRPLQIVVDQLETRDFNAGTDLFVRMAPRDFVRDLNAAADRAGGQVLKEHGQERLAQAWARRNEEERARVGAVREVEAGFEGAYVSALLDELPDRSLLFAANSMSIRAVDTFCDKGARFDILGNRGPERHRRHALHRARRGAGVPPGHAAHRRPFAAARRLGVRAQRGAYARAPRGGRACAELRDRAAQQPWRRHLRHAAAEIGGRVLRAAVPHGPSMPTSGR